MGTQPEITELAPMDITVQWVKTSWTKQSRGGEAAARRNAAPVGFSLPPVPAGFAHFVRISEGDSFEPRFDCSQGSGSAGS